MPLSNITLNDTIDAWRTRDNQSANALNLLSEGGSSGVSPYTKSNGAFLLTGNSSIVVSANGTALQVANSVLFSTDLEVGKNITLGSQSAQTGNLTVGANTFIYGKGTALYVANNVLANSNLQVTNNITTSNISTNNDVSIGRNASIVNKLSMTGTGNVVFVNVGSASINTAYLTDMHSTNAKATRVTIHDTLDVTGLTTHLANVYGTDINLSAGANSYTLNVRTNGTVFGNLNTGNTVTSNTTSTGNLRVTTSANVDGTLRVTGGSNLVSTLRVTDAANLESTLNATGAANLGSTLNATGDTNLGSTLRVTGAANLASTLRVTGGANLDSTLRVAGAASAANLESTLRVTGGANLDSTLRVAGAANLESTMNVAGNTESTNFNTTGLVYANALRTVGRADVGGVLVVTGDTTLTSGQATGNFSVQGDFTINGSVIYNTNQLVLSVASPNQDTKFATYRTNNSLSLANSVSQNAFVRWNETQKYWDLTTDPANNVIYQILDAGRLSSDLTNTSATIISTASAANTLNTRTATAGSYANSAFTKANTATTNAATADQRAVTSGSYANSAYTQANTSTTNAATADQRAVTSGSYANSAFAAANTADQRAVTSGSYANSAYTQANTSTTNAATADQRAVTSGSYANSAYAQANTATTNAATADGKAVTADQRAVTSGSYANSAYTQANTSTTNAATADQRAVTSGSYANSAYAAANTKVSSVSGTAPVVSSGGTTPAISMAAATSSVNGYMTSTYASKLDGIAAGATNVTNNNQLTNGAGYVTSSGVTSVTGTSPVVSSGGATPAISMAAATTSVSGYLTSTDWTTFNNKQASGSYVTVGGALGTPSSGTLTNCTFPTLNQNTTGTASNITSYTINQSVGSSNSPTFTGLTINGAITATGDITGGTSDARLKTNILPITNALSKVNRISGVTYNMSDLASSLGIGNTEDRVGVIAQELEQVLPQVVKPAPFDTDRDGNSISGENYKTVQYEKIVPLLIEAIKELTAKVNTLESQINK
jgi:dihydroxyacetone kinase DhaKLM complex PTS-EIIA-like component DhaM